PSGAYLLSGGRDGKVCLKAAFRSWETIWEDQNLGCISSVAFSQNGWSMAACGAKHAYLWHRTNNFWHRDDHHFEANRYPLKGHYSATSVVFSPDGKTLATGGGDCKIRLWDPHWGRKRKQLSGQNCSVRVLAFAPDSRTLASPGNDWTVSL